MSRKRIVLLDSLILVCFSALLIRPLFRLQYLDNWSSIESTFIAQARMLSEHLPHPGWQPLWYAGTRTDYIYPPALLYGTALISRFAHVAPAYAYHLYIAVFYVVGIAAVYWMVQAGSDSRRAAWLASAAAALLSPSFLFLKQIRQDSGHWIPQRLHVLMAYGEGPHIASLCILPAALAATFLALRRRNRWLIALAAALCALVVSTNFYGATALAILYPLMVWSVWNGERRRNILIPAGAIPLLAYGLCAFWFTPSYARITLINLKWVSQPGTLPSFVVMAITLVLYGALSWYLASGRPEREWSSFVMGAAAVLGVYVLGFFYFGFRTVGEPVRLVPELDLALTLAGVETLRILWTRPRLRVALAVTAIIAFAPALRYLKNARSPFPKSPPIADVYEYRITRWVNAHFPGERVLPSGSVRFWFNAWFDNAQADGGSVQGMMNQNIPAATWQIEHGDRADLAILWLQALGTSAVVVPGKESFDQYHDYSVPEKFRGAAPLLYDDQHGTVIYGIPRVHPGLVRVVDDARMRTVGPIAGGDDSATLTRYVAAIEDPAQPPAVMAWRGFDDMDIQARVQPGQSILIQETYDPAWRAFMNGTRLPVRLEPTLGFMLISAPQGPGNIHLRFVKPLENWIGQGIFVVALLIVGAMVLF